MMADMKPMQSRSKFSLWYFFMLYWKNSSRTVNILLIVAMVVTSVLQVFSMLAFNGWQKHFFDSLQAYNHDKIIFLVFCFFIIAVFLTGAIALNNYLIGFFSLKWRKYLTEYIKQLWLSNRRYDQLQKSTQIDNPEQRISDDLGMMPQLAVTIVNQIFQAMLTLSMFGWELWSLSKQWGFKVNDHVFHIPGIYLWVMLIYAGFFNIMIFTLGHNLIKLNYFNQALTANFRYIMSLIREHSQQVFLQQLELHHKNKTDADFMKIIKNALGILRLDRIIQFFRAICMDSAFVILQVVALSAYFIYHLQIGYLMQVGSAGSMFNQGLIVLIIAYESIAQLRASHIRTSELAEKLFQLNQHIEVENKIIRADDLNIDISDLVIYTADNRVLFNISDMRFLYKKKYLLVGESGLGKSTLLQSVIGMHPYFKGRLTLPKSFNYIYVPQDVFIPSGILLDMLFLYKSEDTNIDLAIDVLAKLGLKELSDKLQIEGIDWQKLLSVSERQKICLAQALLAKPKFLFVDSCDMIFDEENEKRFCKVIQELPDTTIIVTANNIKSEKIFDYTIDIRKFKFLYKELTSLLLEAPAV